MPARTFTTAAMSRGDHGEPRNQGTCADEVGGAPSRRTRPSLTSFPPPSDLTHHREASGTAAAVSQLAGPSVALATYQER